MPAIDAVDELGQWGTEQPHEPIERVGRQGLILSDLGRRDLRLASSCSLFAAGG